MKNFVELQKLELSNHKLEKNKLTSKISVLQSLIRNLETDKSTPQDKSSNSTLYPNDNPKCLNLQLQILSVGNLDYYL